MVTYTKEFLYIEVKTRDRQLKTMTLINYSVYTDCRFGTTDNVAGKVNHGCIQCLVRVG